MPRFVCAIIGSRSKESMEVLSNKQIYILLKILNDKRIQDGSASYIEVDKTFTLEELEHIKQEIIAYDENFHNIIKIESVEKKYFRAMLHSGYKIHIHNLKAVQDYAVNYIKTYIKGDLVGITSDSEFIKLLKDFYSVSKDQTDIANFNTNELKFMPVVLFAYINNFVDLKSITHEEYDYTVDYPYDDIMFDNPFYFKLQANGGVHETRVNLNMDMTKLSDIMVTIGIGNQVEEVNADIVLEMLARIKAERASNPDESYDETALRNKIKRDFCLTELAVNILCACKYLMDTDITSVTNKKISEYFDKINYPVSDETIKQYTMHIKGNCSLTDTRGVPSLVQALELKGYIIPPLTPTSKLS